MYFKVKLRASKYFCITRACDFNDSSVNAVIFLLCDQTRLPLNNFEINQQILNDVNLDLGNFRVSVNLNSGVRLFIKDPDTRGTNATFRYPTVDGIS